MANDIPIFASGRNAERSAAPARPIRRNKANCQGAGRPPGGNPRHGRHGGSERPDRVKQTQFARDGHAWGTAGSFCETNPIRWEPDEGQLLCRTMVMREHRLVPLGKQSQFCPGGLAVCPNGIRRNALRRHVDRGCRAKQSQFAASAAGTPGPIVRNKANFPEAADPFGEGPRIQGRMASSVLSRGAGSVIIQGGHFCR